MQDDLEQLINSLYKQISDLDEKIAKAEKDKNLQNDFIKDLQKELKIWQEEKEFVEDKVELIEKDRLVLKNELQDLRVFELDLYNKVVDKDSQIEKLNTKLDHTTESLIKLEKSNEKLMRKLDTTEKNLLQHQKQSTEKIESLNRTILNDRRDINDLNKSSELKHKEITELK